MSDGLVAFLCARLDEDEYLVGGFKFTGDTEWSEATLATIWGRSENDPLIRHAARYDAARALREVEAGRSLLVELAAAKVACTQASSICIDMRDRVSVAKYDATVAATYAAWRGLQRMALAKAAVYRDHPDYRAEWAP